MNYFVSNINGNIKRYEKFKKLCGADIDDKLWIIGNAIGGTNPDESIEIINDLILSPNIKLILGATEYNLVMSLQPEIKDCWIDKLKTVSPNAVALVETLEALPDTELSRIKDYFISCELSETVIIGKKAFYTISGFPALYRGTEEIVLWYTRLCESKADFNFFPYHLIETDPCFASKRGMGLPLDSKDTFVILGNSSAVQASQATNTLIPEDGVFYKNHIFTLGRENDADPIPVLAVDSAGFYVKGEI